MGKLDPDDARPPYLQVAEAVRAEMDSGELQPGDKLPTHAAMAEAYGVSIGTVKRALALLQTDGLIVTRQGQGAYVRMRPAQRADADADALADVRADLAALAERVTAVERRLAER